jgi:DNA anti-recombination protein RmuC
MALAQEDIDFIKSHLGEWLAEQSLGKPPAVYEIELRERIVRVEEELKHQRELMREGFAQMDKRFTALQTSMDQRFEAMQTTMDQRFEAMQTTMDQRFEAMQTSMDQRFEQVDKRFEQVDKRFEGVQQDIRNLQQRMDSFMRWSFGITIGVGGVIIGVLKLWP